MMIFAFMLTAESLADQRMLGKADSESKAKRTPGHKIKSPYPATPAQVIVARRLNACDKFFLRMKKKLHVGIVAALVMGCFAAMATARIITGYQLLSAFGTNTFTQPLCIRTPPGETNRVFVLEKTG